MNNPIWIMTSAVKNLKQDEIIRKTKEVGAQGMELCVFRRDGSRKDHVATHLDYEQFGPDQAARLLDRCNKDGLRFSVGAYENLVGGDPEQRALNQNHLLRLIRIAALCGGDRNDVKVGTFVGYNHELGVQDRGFEKNLEEYVRVFKPIIKYAESLGVTIIYENCPMEGWRPATAPTTYNNLPATLAARKLMYALIPSRAHGETYDPSHDVWQNINPCDVLNASDMKRVHRIHVKGTRNLQTSARIHWGALYPMQTVDPKLAKKAGVPIPAHEWDRHHYEPVLPGFGGYDSMDWRAFLETVMNRGFNGPFVIENEGANSAHTGNLGATLQGFKATILNLAPVLWPLDPQAGYKFDASKLSPLAQAESKDIPLKTMADL
ncbi:MAG TPA: TIM barrel protein [Candidatus Paceibacterota bacterium]|nr:TIM barrel protein [Verrucomicrobiota bacterium]HRY51747.1 TIM barrel protein [Candidatus Paceibacterota bacterium]